MFRIRGSEEVRRERDEAYCSRHVRSVLVVVPIPDKCLGVGFPSGMFLKVRECAGIIWNVREEGMESIQARDSLHARSVVVVVPVPVWRSGFRFQATGKKGITTPMARVRSAKSSR